MPGICWDFSRARLGMADALSVGMNAIVDLKETHRALGYKLRTVNEATRVPSDWAHIFPSAEGWRIRHGKGQAQPISDPLATVRSWRDNGLAVGLWHCYGPACMTPAIKAELLEINRQGGDISSGMCPACQRAFLATTN